MIDFAKPRIRNSVWRGSVFVCALIVAQALCILGCLWLVSVVCEVVWGY